MPTKSSIRRHLGLFNEAESNYFKRVLEEIAISGCYYLSSIHVLNLASLIAAPNNRRITKQRAQELIDIWCQAGYFIEMENNMLHFGPRTIGEFANYLSMKYKEHIHICSLCLKPTFNVCNLVSYNIQTF